jgi:transaldolase
MVTAGIYADGADLSAMRELSGKVEGWTTNPSLLKKSGIVDYREFAHAVAEFAGGLPVSYEVLAGDMEGMLREARDIAKWPGNVFVKIPVLTVSGAFTGSVISRLTQEGVSVNVTAIMTLDQVNMVLASLQRPGSIISIFAGRIADTGVDPEPIVKQAVRAAKGEHSILWASVREVFNVVQASRCGADIITLTPELIKKMDGFGRDLTEYSIETVRQFARDAEDITL